MGAYIDWSLHDAPVDVAPSCKMCCEGWCSTLVDLKGGQQREALGGYASCEIEH